MKIGNILPFLCKNCWKVPSMRVAKFKMQIWICSVPELEPEYQMGRANVESQQCLINYDLQKMKFIEDFFLHKFNFFNLREIQIQNCSFLKFEMQSEAIFPHQTCAAAPIGFIWILDENKPRMFCIDMTKLFWKFALNIFRFSSVIDMDGMWYKS